MPLIHLEGKTLGEKRKYYTNILKNYVVDASYKVPRINSSDSDLDKLFMVDLSCNRQDLEYTLNVLKSDDIFLVSSALKQSPWLTEDQYAHIINPHYLNKKLLPLMSTKAKNKLQNFIKLNLKNEDRMDEFFNFYKYDFKLAKQYLPYCSEALITRAIKEYGNFIETKLTVRLCQKAFGIFRDGVSDISPSCIQTVMESCRFYLFSNTKEYIEIISKLEAEHIPKFRAKATKLLLKENPNVILLEFEKFHEKIDLAVLARYLKEKGILTDFLSSLLSTQKLRIWLGLYANMKHFITFIPTEERSNFINQVTLSDDDNKTISGDGKSFWELPKSANKEDFYHWYSYASFDTAFKEITPLLSQECSPKVITDLWSVLIRCAEGNFGNIKSILSYYTTNHMDELYILKLNFINTVITLTKVHEYDSTLWNILNEIFHSMDIYAKGNNDIRIESIQKCIQCTTVYNILRDERIPETIENKIKISTFNQYRYKLKPCDQEKVFQYLYEVGCKRLLIKTTDEEKMLEVKKHIVEMLNFLKYWKRDKVKYDEYYRKLPINNSFETFLKLYPSYRMCMNAFNQDPGLFSRQDFVMRLLSSNRVGSLRRLVQMLRLYWPDSLAQVWVDSYIQSISLTSNKKPLIKELFTILNREQALSLIEKHMGNEGDEVNKRLLSYLHLVRPSIDLTKLMGYDKETLKFVVPAFNVLLFDLNDASGTSLVCKLLDVSPVLQKHVIRHALKKIYIKEIKEALVDAWRKDNDLIVKKDLFKYTYKIVCKESNVAKIEILWDLLRIFIEEFPAIEKKIIESRIDKFYELPVQVRYKFFMKCYAYLNTLTDADKVTLLYQFNREINPVIGNLDINFMKEVLKPVFTNYSEEYGFKLYLKILSKYLISCKSEEQQVLIYETLFEPVMNGFIESWQEKQYMECVSDKRQFKRLLEQLVLDTVILVFRQDYVMPVKLFKDIQKKLKSVLSIHEDYGLLTFWNVSTLFIPILRDYTRKDDYNSNITNLRRQFRFFYYFEDPLLEHVYLDVASMFGEACHNYFQADLSSKQPSLFMYASQAIMDVIICFCFSYKCALEVLKCWLSKTKDPVSYYVVSGVIRCMVYLTQYTTHYFEDNEELNKIIEAHPSKEVKIHYNLRKLDNRFCSEHHSHDWYRPGFMSEMYEQ